MWTPKSQCQCQCQCQCQSQCQANIVNAKSNNPWYPGYQMQILKFCKSKSHSHWSLFCCWSSVSKNYFTPFNLTVRLVKVCILSDVHNWCFALFAPKMEWILHICLAFWHTTTLALVCIDFGLGIGIGIGIGTGIGISFGLSFITRNHSRIYIRICTRIRIHTHIHTRFAFTLTFAIAFAFACPFT